MDVFWIVAQPWDPAVGAATTVRATSCDLTPCVIMNALEFLPVISEGPTFSTSVFDGAAVGPATSTRGDLLLIAQLGEIDNWASLGWSQRPIQIYYAALDLTTPNQPVFPTWAELTLIFDGVIDAYDADRASFSLSTTLPSGKIASLTYPGTGGINGAAEIKGAVKPWASGRHLNRPATLIDPALLMYQVHGYGPIQELTNIREAGTILDQTRVNWATATQLSTATVLPTEIHTCLASGMFRIGFQPIGTITADFKGDNGGGTFSARPGVVIKRLLTQTGWPTGKIAQDSLDDLDSSVPYDVFCYDDTGSDVLDLITGILQPMGGYWDVDPLGNFYVGLFREKASEDFTVGEPSFLATYDLYQIDEMPTRAPFWRNRIGYGYNPQVFSPTELRIDAALDIAASTATWSGVIDDNGHKPDNDADVTLIHTAAGIVSQGLLATLNSLVLGGPYLSGFGGLASLSNVSFGSGQILEASGGASAVLSAFKTALGTAASIAGQGLLATLNAANWATQVTGTGKPADYSTRNEDGDNMLEDPLKMSSMVIGQAPVTLENAGGAAGSGRGLDNFRIRLDGNNAWAYLQGKKMPVTPGEKLFSEFYVFRTSGAGSAEIVLNLHCFDGAGNYLTTVNCGYTLNPTADTWVRITGTCTVPNCSLVLPFFQRYNSGPAGSVYFSEPYIGRKQKGADVTGTNTAAAFAGQGLLATLNLINSIAYLADYLIATTTLGVDAATSGGTAYTPGPYYFTSMASLATMASVPFTITRSARVKIVTSWRAGFPSGDKDWQAMLQINGTTVRSRGGAKTSGEPCITYSAILGPGSYTAALIMGAQLSVSGEQFDLQVEVSY